jgi:alanyl-tRNA synthetase
MTSGEIRQKYLQFFEARGHKIIPAAPLVLANDPTTLFTSSGMQPLVPYLLGQPHPAGKRLVDSQPCFRAQDIEEVGDNRHTTFFEMLGNWSLGDYFKSEQLAWFWEFLTDELGLPSKRLAVTVFEGNADVPRDEESARIWKSLGMKRIFYYGVDKNWWSRSGVPAAMPAGEPGGPDSEVFFEFTGVPHDPKYGKVCHPNCDCGRFLEIGNSVFMQYQKQADGSLQELAQKNVDFGGGLERLTVATSDGPDIFKIDIFMSMRKRLENDLGDSQVLRIVLDHLRAAEVMITTGVTPSNKEQGYMLRRLIRRAALQAKLVNVDLEAKIDNEVIREEIKKFKSSLDRGLKLVGKISAFDLWQTYGFPKEITQELLKQQGKHFDEDSFNKDFEAHQQKSRRASRGKFAGGLADHSETVTKLHTATHLLQAALRQILGSHVRQEGSNITAERLRFDFSHPKPITAKEAKAAENLLNAQIKANLPVVKTVEDRNAALASGAVAFFREKYGDKVSVYTIGDFSRELCGGPHVAATGMIGSVKIDKVQAIGTGLKRIYASICPTDQV